MPELPEVETIVGQLNRNLLGKVITKLVVFDPKVIDKNISHALPAKITKIWRRGKAIIFDLGNGYHLLTHLRMTGHFYYVNDGSTDYKKYLCGIFYLDDRTFFTHNSIRRFGFMKLLTAKQLELEFSKLGPEPLSPDFTLSLFSSLLRKHPHSNVKSKLMDQSFIVGIGNIYAQEALYLSGISPLRRIKDLPSEKVSLLYRSLRQVLEQGIKNKGTTIQNFTSLEGEGLNQDYLNVYGKDFCPKSHSLQKVNIGGRSTSYCPVCQG
jgi:formamidopyrimidine-DNA glycosylase